ncbi:hypothetical protein L1049_005211 [Liquidambar formosana]|uniref:Uncharacterized protein n=1 Tax=Liquidambar formosana TaxID=63359 RepID=A0AAP0RPI7_LIQFO
MVGGENKLGFVFSWADEVEKEEEEEEAAARTQIHEKQRPNPFGYARPREVVLQEKGFDWRKVDQNLLPPSPTRSEPPKEKPLKENIPAPAAPLAVNHKLPFHPSWKGRQEHKPENINTGSNKREVPQVLSIPQNHIPDDFVPSLRFPPKNVASLLKEERGSYNPYMLDSGQRSFQCKSHVEPMREKAFHELRPKQFHNSESMDRSSFIHHLYQHEFDTE